MIHVMFFGRLAEIAGSETVEVEWEPELDTLAAVRELFCESSPALSKALCEPQVIVSLNMHTTHWNAAVADGDEIAFMPPVTGG